MSSAHFYISKFSSRKIFTVFVDNYWSVKIKIPHASKGSAKIVSMEHLKLSIVHFENLDVYSGIYNVYTCTIIKKEMKIRYLICTLTDLNAHTCISKWIFLA